MCAKCVVCFCFVLCEPVGSHFFKVLKLVCLYNHPNEARRHGKVVNLLIPRLAVPRLAVPRPPESFHGLQSMSNIKKKETRKPCV